MSIGEIALLAQVPVALPLVAVGLRLYGLRRVQAFLVRPSAATGANGSAAVRPEAAERLAWIVRVAAGYGVWRPNCLQRSVVLWWFLRRRGLDGDLRIGVRRNRDSGALDFHAWIEHGGMVLNDDPEIRAKFATFDRAIAPPEAQFD